MTFPKTYTNATTPPIPQAPAGSQVLQDGDFIVSNNNAFVRVSAFAPTFVPNVDISDTAITSMGTSSVSVNGSLYICEMYLPQTKLCTGIQHLNGTIVGTDNVLCALWDEAGTLIRTSALAGALSAGASAWQQLAFVAGAAPTAQVSLPPGRYFTAVQFNGTTATSRKITNSGLRATALQAGVFGTVPNITPPTTFTTVQGVFQALY